MKKLFIIIITISFTSISSAQINIRAGINFSNQYLDHPEFGLDPDGIKGYMIGINYQVELTDAFSIRPGMQLIKKGSYWRLGPIGTDTQANFHYVEFPLDLVYHMHSFIAYLGTNVGLLLSANAFDRNYTQNSGKDDVGINVGLEHHINAFGIGINYSHSFTNIFDSPSSINDVRNRVINIYVTLAL